MADDPIPPRRETRYQRMLRLERYIKGVIKAANSPTVAAFPIRVAMGYGYGKSLFERIMANLQKVDP